MRRVFLVRHALTDFDIASAAGRFCGRSDPPLNDRGRTEAALLAERAPIQLCSEIVASPLKRSRETAEIMRGNADISIATDDRLREIDYAHWDGLTKSDIQSRFGSEYSNFERDPVSFHPGGQQLISQCEAAAWDWLRSTTLEYTIAVTHKTWTRLLLCRLLGIPSARYRHIFDIKIASIICLVLTNAGWRVDAINYEASPQRIYGPLCTQATA